MGNWRKGWTRVVHALNVFKVYPAFLAPIFLVWMVYASGILYLRYGFSWKLHGGWADVGMVFLVIFVFHLHGLCLEFVPVPPELLTKTPGLFGGLAAPA